MLLISACMMLALHEDKIETAVTPDVRERLVAKFDADGDGRLNAKEREELRKSGGQSDKRQSVPGRRQDVGPALTKQFDKDKDGKLNDAEYRAAEGGLRAKFEQLAGKFKAYENGQLNVENLKRMEKAARDGEIKDFPPALYGWIYFVRSRAKKDDKRPAVHPLQKFDKNKDGNLSTAEVKAARQAIAKRRPKASTKP